MFKGKKDQIVWVRSTRDDMIGSFKISEEISLGVLVVDWRQYYSLTTLRDLIVRTHTGFLCLGQVFIGCLCEEDSDISVH